MRNAHHDLQLVKDDDRDGLPLALSLGYDFCAEHEQGIGDMRYRLGAKDDLLGIERHRIDPAQAALRMSMEDVKKTKTKPAYHVLRMDYRKRERAEVLASVKKWDVPDPATNKNGYTSSWDDRAFQVVATDPEVVAFLKDFETALASGNAAIMHLALSGNNPFARTSLSLVIVDRLPDQVIKSLHDGDVDHRKLLKEASDLGFDEVFRKNGLRIRACSPRRIDGETQEERGTSYPMKLWVNSWDDRLKSGWFDVEELQDKLLEIFPDEDLREYWSMIREEMLGSSDQPETLSI